MAMEHHFVILGVTWTLVSRLSGFDGGNIIHIFTTSFLTFHV
jgi:hypothetical protein